VKKSMPASRAVSFAFFLGVWAPPPRTYCPARLGPRGGEGWPTFVRGAKTRGPPLGASAQRVDMD